MDKQHMGTGKQHFEYTLSNGPAHERNTASIHSNLLAFSSVHRFRPTRLSLLHYTDQKLRLYTIQFAVLYLVMVGGLQIDF